MSKIGRFVRIMAPGSLTAFQGPHNRGKDIYLLHKALNVNIQLETWRAFVKRQKKSLRIREDREGVVVIVNQTTAEKPSYNLGWDSEEGSFFGLVRMTAGLGTLQAWTSSNITFFIPRGTPTIIL